MPRHLYWTHQEAIKAEAIEVVLYDWVIWPKWQECFGKIRHSGSCFVLSGPEDEIRPPRPLIQSWARADRMRTYYDYSTNEAVVAGGGSCSHGRWTTPKAYCARKTRGWSQGTCWTREGVGDLCGKRHRDFQHLTKLETHNPRYLELDWNKYRARARICDYWRKE